jgi:hypothetical protein
MTPRWKIRRFGHSVRYWWGAYLTDWSKWEFSDTWDEAGKFIERETV